MSSGLNTGVRWPSGTDYSRTVQHPPSAFHNAVLKSSTLAVNVLGMPLVASGQNAVVFLLRGTDGDQAIRCFTTAPAEGSSRYHALTDHLDSQPPTAITATRWLDDGVTVDGRTWPIVIMPWVSGEPLNLAIEDRLRDAEALHDLADRWVTMVFDLQAADVTHGDLQHGNVLVRSDGSFALVDLDGVWVPTMTVDAPDETGHPNYQHPKRTAAEWGPFGDSFSALLVEVGVRALAADPQLEQFLSGENILFNRADLLDTRTRVWDVVMASCDEEVRRLATILRARATDRADASLVLFADLRQGLAGEPRRPSLRIGVQLPPAGAAAGTNSTLSGAPAWLSGSAGASGPSSLLGVPAAATNARHPASASVASAVSTPVQPGVVTPLVATTASAPPAIAPSGSAASSGVITSVPRTAAGSSNAAAAGTTSAPTGADAKRSSSTAAPSSSDGRGRAALTGVLGGIVGAEAGSAIMSPVVHDLVDYSSRTVGRAILIALPFLIVGFVLLRLSYRAGARVGRLSRFGAAFGLGAAAGVLTLPAWNASIGLGAGFVVAVSVGAVVGLIAGLITKAAIVTHLVVTQGPSAGRWAATSGKLTIGRASSNSLVLDVDGNVRPLHVEITGKGNRLQLRTLTGVPNVLVNGTSTDRGVLKAGDEIVVGSTTVRVDRGGQP